MIGKKRGIIGNGLAREACYLQPVWGLERKHLLSCSAMGKAPALPTPAATVAGLGYKLEEKRRDVQVTVCNLSLQLCF
jgi:hypothetical protein